MKPKGRIILASLEVDNMAHRKMQLSLITHAAAAHMNRIEPPQYGTFFMLLETTYRNVLNLGVSCGARLGL